MIRSATARQARAGFTLVELAVVIVLIGVVAAFGVPRFIKSVERAKAAEAFRYLDAVRAAQEQYAVREGTYASALPSIATDLPAPRYFTVPSTIAAGPVPGGRKSTWSLTLTRTGASAGYGPYTVTYTQDGYDPTHSTIDGMAEINPTNPVTVVGS